jgi:hypothetical protein
MDRSSDKLLHSLADAVDCDISDLRPELDLRDDLGLDSLQIAACVGWLDDLGVFVSDAGEALTTVASGLSLN